LGSTRLYPFGVMSPLQSKGFQRILALLALLLFAGDLLADSVEGLCEMRCASETSQSSSSQDQVPCHCTCAGHIGAVIVTDFAMGLGGDFQPTSYLASANEGTPPRLAASIDHPPQLG
jgi:hypothetical protein